MMEQLRQRIRTQETDTILECIMRLGGEQLGVAERMTRAALIDIYIERTSPEAGDALMDVLGV